jgi:hypothetical protein
MNFEDLNERLAQVSIEEPKEDESLGTLEILRQSAHQAGR